MWELFTKLKENDFISGQMKGRLYNSDGVLPRPLRPLRKIHKREVLLRIIISSVDSQLYTLTAFLHKIIYLRE